MNVRDPHEWIAQQEARISELRERAETAQNALTQTGATTTSDDGAVTVTVGPGGQVTDIRLSPRADGLGHQRLQSAIMTTVRSAQAASVAMTTEVMESLLGSDSDAMAFYRSQIPTVETPDEQSDSAADQAEDDDFDDYNQGNRW